MLRWALICLVIALVAGAWDYGGWKGLQWKPHESSSSYSSSCLWCRLSWGVEARQFHRGQTKPRWTTTFLPSASSNLE